MSAAAAGGAADAGPGGLLHGMGKDLAARPNAPIAAACGVPAEAAERRKADTADAALLRRALPPPRMVSGGRQQ
jgi:hypothetical protein